MWLYNYGGMYADVDVEFYSPIDPLLTSAHADVLLLGGEDAYDYSNCLMLSVPGHELWLRMLEFSKDNKNRFVTQCSGPVALGTVVKWYMEATKNHKIHVFDYNILHWGGYKQGSACLDKIVYEGKLGAHHNSTPEEFHWLNS
jgi:mannosyltransferase OCH1-like enzyme